MVTPATARPFSAVSLYQNPVGIKKALRQNLDFWEEFGIFHLPHGGRHRLRMHQNGLIRLCAAPASSGEGYRSHSVRVQAGGAARSCGRLISLSVIASP